MRVDPKVQALIDDLRGTCQSLTEALENHDVNLEDPGVSEAIDDQIFECTICCWWCEIDEEASEEYGYDEFVCQDCAEAAGQ